jgi:membrane-associated phospholipid phosphatase
VAAGRIRARSPTLLPSRCISWVALLLLASAIPAFAGGFVVVPPPGASAAGPASLFSPDDGWFAAATTVGVAASTFGDDWAWRQSQKPRSPEIRGLARFTQRLGDPRIVGPALLASYFTGRITGLPNFSAASARIAGASFCAAVFCEGLKLAVGRARPNDAPGDPDDIRPFRRLDASFPSGHTTIAFAAAAAIDEESAARWVPWVVYPAASAVGWARVSENHHWLSDVVAGAALGYWTGRKVDRIERGHSGIFDRASFLASGSRRNFRVGFKTRF